jgi:hypothetical protein
MDEEFSVSGTSLLIRSDERNHRNHCNHVQGDKTPHAVQADRQGAVLMARIDYADYVNYGNCLQQWQDSGC